MAKINVDIEYIKEKLELIGYRINDCIQKENNGIVWQIKFYNSNAIANIYDTNKKNTVVNGKPDEGEKEKLKNIIDMIKSKELFIDDINKEIVELIELKKEGTYWDFKEEWHSKSDDLLHDILCLSNNTKNRDAYLIIGVKNDGTVIGTNQRMKSNDVFDLLKTKKYAGDHMPEIEMKSVYYKFYEIDVLLCKSSKFVPFFLVERSGPVCDYQIYTRVGDTNTAKNRNASYSDMEKLWRIHFERENEE